MEKNHKNTPIDDIAYDPVLYNFTKLYWQDYDRLNDLNIKLQNQSTWRDSKNPKWIYSAFLALRERLRRFGAAAAFLPFLAERLRRFGAAFLADLRLRLAVRRFGAALLVRLFGAMIKINLKNDEKTFEQNQQNPLNIRKKSLTIWIKFDHKQLPAPLDRTCGALERT